MTINIDKKYVTDYISQKPDSETRSIAELVEVERLEGYSQMSDKEITYLISYKEEQAKKSEEIKIYEEHEKQRTKLMAVESEARYELAQMRFQQAMSETMEFISVKDVDNG